MPRVRIDIRKGRSEQEKHDLMEAVHQALVEAIKIPDYDRIQTLYEHDEVSFMIPPSKSEKYTLIEIMMFPGRSLDAKRRIYQEITKHLKPLGIEAYDTMFILHETPMENWGVNGQPASPIEFKIDV